MGRGLALPVPRYTIAKVGAIHELPLRVDGGRGRRGKPLGYRARLAFGFILISG